MEHAGDRFPGRVQPNNINMNTFKIRLMQHIKGQWYSMPWDVEVEATDPATAITIAWDRAIRAGAVIKKFILLT